MMITKQKRMRNYVINMDTDCSEPLLNNVRSYSILSDLMGRRILLSSITSMGTSGHKPFLMPLPLVAIHLYMLYPMNSPVTATFQYHWSTAPAASH